MCNYKAFFPGKSPIDIVGCVNAYEAQKRAATVWKIKPKQVYKITVVLCEKDGNQVTHNPAEFS